MALPTVDFEQVKDKLLTLDQVRERLSATEPLHRVKITSDDTIKFAFEPGWADSIDTMHGDDPIEAVISINGRDHTLTKDAALEAGAKFGLTAAFAKKISNSLLETNLNELFKHNIGSKEFTMLLTGHEQQASAFMKSSLTPFSNQIMLDYSLASIRQHYGSEVYADYKFYHSLKRTDIRLILPDYTRIIADTDVDDDAWSAGIHLSNSLSAEGKTGVEAYLFRWWCTNGATTEMNAVGTWSRRSGGQEESSVYEWARDSVDEILGGMEHKFEQVQALTSMPLGDELTQELLRSIFKDYGVPVSQRDQIISELEKAEHLTMYALMQAITRTANAANLRPERIDNLMRIGGSIPTTQFDLNSARIFRRGQLAGPEARNPYEVHMAVAGA